MDLADGVAMHFETTGGMNAITVPYNESIEGTVNAKLYKFMGSYFATLKRDPVQHAILGESAEDQTLIFSEMLDAGI